jgi:hypothetical protein
MEMIKRYNERVIWANTYSVQTYTRPNKNNKTLANYVSSYDKLLTIIPNECSIIVSFKRCIAKDFINSFMQRKYESLEFMCGDVYVTITNATVTYVREDNSRVIVEINAKSVNQTNWGEVTGTDAKWEAIWQS